MSTALETLIAAYILARSLTDTAESEADDAKHPRARCSERSTCSAWAC